MAIYYGDGSNSNSGRVLGQKHSFNQSRSSMNGNPNNQDVDCLLYTSPSPRDCKTSRMPSSA